MSPEPKKSFISGKPWLIALIIIVNGYLIYTGIRGLVLEKRQWKDQEINAVIDRCIQDAGNNGVKYPNATRAYCECSFKEIRIKFNKKEYLEIITKPIDEQKKLLLPLFQDCLTDYQEKIKRWENNSQ